MVAALALVLYLVWVLVAFGVRAVMQLRRTGDAGFRGFHGAVGSPAWWVGLLFVVAVVAGIGAPVADLVGLGPTAALDHAGVRVVAAGIALAGIVLTLAAQLAMGDAWRVGVDPAERTPLVTNGPFRIVRNPIFAAMTVTAIGLAFLVGSVVALAGLVTLGLALELQVRVVEEPHLLALHGDVYRRYSSRVGRFVPGVGRRVSAPRPGMVR